MPSPFRITPLPHGKMKNPALLRCTSATEWLKMGQTLGFSVIFNGVLVKEYYSLTEQNYVKTSIRISREDFSIHFPYHVTKRRIYFMWVNLERTSTFFQGATWQKSFSLPSNQSLIKLHGTKYKLLGLLFLFF